MCHCCSCTSKNIWTFPLVGKPTKISIKFAASWILSHKNITSYFPYRVYSSRQHLFRKSQADAALLCNPWGHVVFPRSLDRVAVRVRPIQWSAEGRCNRRSWKFLKETRSEGVVCPAWNPGKWKFWNER